MQPWHKITKLTGGKGVAAEWQDFPDDLLYMTLAQAIPCGSSSGCYMNVIEHSPSDLVGSCITEPRRYDRRAFIKPEVALYTLNHTKLFKPIATTLSFNELQKKIDNMPVILKVGHINPQAELKLPVFILLYQTISQLDKAVNTLCINQANPFLFILPIGSIASHVSLDTTNKCKSKIIGLDDICEIMVNDNMRSKKSIDGIINNWLEPILPKSGNSRNNNKFPTPAGAQ